MEDDECIQGTLLAGMLDSSCRLNFGDGVKSTHGFYISLTCWRHRVFFPTHLEEQQNRS